jgi:hypothetical protein
MYLGELEGMKIITATRERIKLAQRPETNYLRSLYCELRKAFNPYSPYFILYYIYMLDGVRNYYTVDDLIKVFFFKEKIQNKSDCIKDEGKDELFIDENNYVKDDRRNEQTLLCNTRILSQQDHLERLNQALDFNYLPVFDSKTGEFNWLDNNSSDINNNNIFLNKNFNAFKSEDMYPKSLDLRNGSMISINSSIIVDREEDVLQTSHQLPTRESNFKTQGSRLKINPESSDKQKALIDELNDLLKKLDVN